MHSFLLLRRCLVGTSSRIYITVLEHKILHIVHTWLWSPRKPWPVGLGVSNTWPCRRARPSFEATWGCQAIQHCDIVSRADNHERLIGRIFTHIHLAGITVNFQHTQCSILGDCQGVRWQHKLYIVINKKKCAASCCWDAALLAYLPEFLWITCLY